MASIDSITATLHVIERRVDKLQRAQRAACYAASWAYVAGCDVKYGAPAAATWAKARACAASAERLAGGAA